MGAVRRCWLVVFRKCPRCACCVAIPITDCATPRPLCSTHRDGKRVGLHLDESVRGAVEEGKARLAKLAIQYQQALGEVNTQLTFTRDQLAGQCSLFLCVCVRVCACVRVCVCA